MIDLMILVATVLGMMFPAYLIKAIRCGDKAAADKHTAAACILFGAIVFITLVIVRS